MGGKQLLKARPGTSGVQTVVPVRARAGSCFPFLVPLLLFAVIPGAAAQKHVQKSFPVGPGAALNLETRAGSIRITGGSSPQVIVDVIVEGREKDVQDFDVTAEKSGERVDVRGARMTQGEWVWYSPVLHVSYSVTVPRDCNVRVHTSAGAIEIDGVQGILKGGTSEGDIGISGTTGDVSLETYCGSIRADSCSGTISLHSFSGGVSVMSLSGDLDVNTAGGDVRVVGAEGQIRALTGGGNMIVSLKGENRGVHLESSGGDIDLALPPRFAGNIDAEANGGSVICSLPGHAEGDGGTGELDEPVNGGGKPVFVHTAGGNVRLHPAD